MRISTGILKGLYLEPIKGIRPTQDKVKNAVFNILGNDLSGVRFLELYAGSGVVGFEALSRGAEEVFFVENNPLCVKAINDAINKIGSRGVSRYASARTRSRRGVLQYASTDTIRIFKQDSLGAIEEFCSNGEKFDIIFADPPYYQRISRDTARCVSTQQIGAKKTLQALSRYDIMTANGILIIQASAKEILEETCGSLRLIRSYRYADTVLKVYKKE